MIEVTPNNLLHATSDLMAQVWEIDRSLICHLQVRMPLTCREVSLCTCIRRWRLPAFDPKSRSTLGI